MNGRSWLSGTAVLVLAATLVIWCSACGRKAKPEPLWGRLRPSGIQSVSR